MAVHLDVGVAAQGFDSRMLRAARDEQRPTVVRELARERVKQRAAVARDAAVGGEMTGVYADPHAAPPYTSHAG